MTKGTTFATIEAFTVVSLKKNEEFTNPVIHHWRRNVMLGADYKNAVVKHDKNPLFKPQPMWNAKATYEHPYMVVHRDTGQRYIRYFLLKGKPSIDSYYDSETGEFIDKQRLTPYFRKKRPQKRQNHPFQTSGGVKPSNVYPRTLKIYGEKIGIYSTGLLEIQANKRTIYAQDLVEEFNKL
jgi:hypothetical protein